MALPKTTSRIEEYDGDLCIGVIYLTGCSFEYKARVAARMRKKTDSTLKMRCGTMNYVKRGKKKWKWEQNNERRLETISKD